MHSLTYVQCCELYALAVGAFCYLSHGQAVAVDYHATFPWGRCEQLTPAQAARRWHA